ncbi:MAG: hypothetical protein ABSG37_14905 [Candidatus Limnocylindrales bacterium]
MTSVVVLIFNLIIFRVIFFSVLALVTALFQLVWRSLSSLLRANPSRSRA